MPGSLPFESAFPAAPTAPREGSGRDLVLALLPGLCALALYAPLLGAPALEVSDAAVRGFPDLGAAARAGAGAALLHLEGLTASAFVPRLVALLLHAGASALVYACARRLALARGAALFLALLFAAAPLRVEAVAWLAQRDTLLGGFLFLLGASFAPSTGLRLGLRTLCLALGLLCAPDLFLGVPLLLWLDGRTVSAGPLERVASPRFALGLGLALTLLGAGLWLATKAGEGSPPFATRLVHAPVALLALAAQAFTPLAATPHHPHPALSGAPLPAWVLWACALALLAALGLALAQRRSALARGALLFLALALPAALAPHGEVLFREADAYLPLLGLELALVLLVAPRCTPRVGAALGTSLLIALFFFSLRRLPAWRSEPALQNAALALRPEPRAHAALGQWHLLHGRLGRADESYAHALTLRPQDLTVGLLRAELELRRGLIPGQEAHFLKARELLLPLQALPRARAVLGEVLQRLRDARGARAAFEAALADEPDDALTQLRLGMVLLGEDPGAARAAFQRACALDSRSFEAWYGLGLTHLLQNEGAQAEDCFLRALALEPDHAQSRAALGRLQETRGQRAEAERNYRRAVGVHPAQLEALFGLGALLASSARGDEALRYLERVVELSVQPPHVRACLEVARLRMARGETELPRQRLQAVLAFNPEHPEARALLRELDAAGER